LHPVAVQIFAEEGLAVEGHIPKSVDYFRGQRLDVVVTIGEPARRLIPESLRHVACYRPWDIEDPAEEPAELVPAAFRRASATIQRQLDVLLAELRATGWLKP